MEGLVLEANIHSAKVSDEDASSSLLLAFAGGCL
jgi:hypothetical protein